VIEAANGGVLERVKCKLHYFPISISHQFEETSND